jgi:ionotropic glutamate receptor
MISHALDSFLRRRGEETSSLSFVNSSSPGLRDKDTDLARLKVLKDGDVLLSHLQATNFSSVTGFVSVDERGDAKGISFEIVNMVDLDHQLGWQVIGYWVNGTGCTSTPPPSMDEGRVVRMSTVTNASSTDDDPVKLREVVWPGNSTQIPRGWVLPQNGIPLSIGVPNKTGYTEFVTTMVDAHGHTVFRGFCMDVFENATKLLPYAVKFKYVSFGNGSKTPNYNELIDRITTKVSLRFCFQVEPILQSFYVYTCIDASAKSRCYVTCVGV